MGEDRPPNVIDHGFSDVGIAFYDLDSCGVTYNIFEFLELAQHELKAQGCTSGLFVFVPSSKAYSRLIENSDYGQLVDESARAWRMWNILIPAVAFFPYFTSHEVLNDRSSVRRYSGYKTHFPLAYQPIGIFYIDTDRLYNTHLSRPENLIGLSVPNHALEKVESLITKNGITKNKLLTVTLRSQSYDPLRNTNLEAWEMFANWLKKADYHLIVLPDQDTYYDYPLNSFGDLNSSVRLEFTWNIYLRAALYEKAALNFFVNNGPSILATFNPRCHYIIMNLLSPGSIVTNRDELRKTGFLKFEDRLPFAIEGQRVSHKIESFESLKDEFFAFLGNENAAKFL